MRDFSVGNLITSYRSRVGLKQNEVANPDDPELLSVALRTYQGWENGERIPSNKWLRRITSFFHLTDAEADELYRAAAQVAPEIENLPFQQNPFFTGRETYLEQLDQYLKENGSVALTQSISMSGLGGIGKTQLALEYAHRHHPKVYRTVLWANAVDKATLEASYLSLARLLKLPEKDEREVDLIVQAVKMWLKEHTSWLLILDNADDLQLARSFIPTKHRGHVLLTTRSQIIGNIAVRIEIEAMEREEGFLFLLRRSHILSDGIGPEILASGIREAATQVVELLGRHPLALDQAGAYIEETGDSFANYVQIYHEQRLTLLNERGSLGDEHPETVVVSFEMSFQRACKLCPLAADVLHFCSFLHPDAIPEELLELDDSLKLDTISFNKAIAALQRYSLIKRDVQKKMLSIHRLVQAVLQDAMPSDTQRQWKQQAVRAVNKSYPDVQDITQWDACEQWLSHVLICVAWIEQEQINSLEAARLLNKAGYYLSNRARYGEAEPLYVRALAIYGQQLGAEHPETAQCLNNLAEIYRSQGKYAEAEQLMVCVIVICEQQLGPSP